MAGEGLTLGKAIDQILSALESLDETSRETALSAVCRQLKISINGPLASSTPSQEPTQPQKLEEAASPRNVPATQVARMDIRSLKTEKNPRSAKEMACIVAYYLGELAPENERKDTISTTDLEKYFKQAGFALPAKIKQVLIDAKASGYFESAARGEYKLNAVGHNLVVHGLPRKD